MLGTSLRGQRFSRHLLWGVLGLLLLSVPLLIQNQYHMRILVVVLLYVVLASSLNIINGYSGMFNIGHAGFYCIGAYTAAILAVRYGLGFWLLLPLSGLAAGLASLLFVGFPAARLRGLFFAMTTLGFSEIVRLTALNWTTLTRGPMGIPGIPFVGFMGRTLTMNWQYYYIVLGITAVMLVSSYRVLSSRIGRAWLAMREDEQAAKSMGIDVFRYRLLNLFFSSFWAGVAGCFYAFFASYISADSFSLDEGFSILAMVIVGGQGSLLGPVVGAAFLTILTEVFRGVAEYRLVVFGLAILAAMHLRPQGIAGSGRDLRWNRNSLRSHRPRLDKAVSEEAK